MVDFNMLLNFCDAGEEFVRHTLNTVSTYAHEFADKIQELPDTFKHMQEGYEEWEERHPFIKRMHERINHSLSKNKGRIGLAFALTASVALIPHKKDITVARTIRPSTPFIMTPREMRCVEL